MGVELEGGEAKFTQTDWEVHSNVLSTSSSFQILHQPKSLRRLKESIGLGSKMTFLNFLLPIFSKDLAPTGNLLDDSKKILVSSLKWLTAALDHK